ncbi:unnamed protein product, partial [marine sediment metagenome]
MSHKDKATRLQIPAHPINQNFLGRPVKIYYYIAEENDIHNLQLCISRIHQVETVKTDQFSQFRLDADQIFALIFAAQQ